ncbi:MAG TPA: hypothetical protein VEK38_02495 [Candidatus Bathyarchaeia archaeon]|nr:hypothetical protein [Candidatus Bathyarchaeia archaeon]
MKQITLFIVFFLVQNNAAYKAVVIVPVADLFAHPPNTTVDDIPVHTAQQSPTPCPRLHQLLFHEQITVTDEKGRYVCVHIPHLFYTITQSSTPQNTYWTLAKNIFPLSPHVHQQCTPYLPDTPSFTQKSITPKQSTITLTLPFYYTAREILFSVGTRFVIAEQTTSQYSVYVFNAQKKCIEKMTIPYSHAMLISPAQTAQEQRKKFVTLLKQWAHPPDGFIPYVWGGCSFTECYTGSFTKTDHAQSCHYTYNSQTQQIKGGFDCSGLIARAAQACNIAYFYKNTTTMTHNLKQKTAHDSIEEGDIIWIPGHVMVVADIKNHTLIESRSYGHGYGKVHEIALNNVFENIHTFNDLKTAYHHKKPLQHLDCFKKRRELFTQFKIFSLLD